jgi:putative phosphoesterase
VRIGVFSDIHANLYGLQKALDLLDSEQVEQILCAGDLVDPEPNADAVVELLRQRAIPCVMGNHDQAVTDYQDSIYQPGESGDPMLFNDVTIKYLKALPLAQSFTFGNIRVTLAHGIPWKNTVYAFPESDSDFFGRIATVAQSDVVILGHTHVPMCIQADSTWIVNPGSVDGNRRQTIQTCAVIDLSPFYVRIFDINTRKVVRTCGKNGSG